PRAGGNRQVNGTLRPAIFERVEQFPEDAGQGRAVDLVNDQHVVVVRVAAGGLAHPYEKAGQHLVGDVAPGVNCGLETLYEIFVGGGGVELHNLCTAGVACDERSEAPSQPGLARAGRSAEYDLAGV